MAPQLATEQERNAIAQLVAELYPGARLTRLEEMKGGLSARVQLVEARTPEEKLERFVLRRYNSGGSIQLATTQVTSREFRTLQVLEEAGVSAPRPILLDTACQRFNLPAMVLSFVPGVTRLTPHNHQLAETAAAIAKVHAISPRDKDLSFLAHKNSDYLSAKAQAALEPSLARNALAQRVSDVLVRGATTMTWQEPCLIHGDYWPGNVVWLRDKLSGIVDWTFAALGDPREDLAQMRIDLSLLQGINAADGFLEQYEGVTGQPQPDVWFFDLLSALSCMAVLPTYEKWLKGYHDLGLSDLTYAVCNQRLRDFIEQALAKADL